MADHARTGSLRRFAADERGEAGVAYLVVIVLALGLTLAVHASAVPFAFAIDRVHELVLSDVP